MIVFNEEDKIFHLSNKYISYILKIDEYNQLLHIYFGKKIQNSNFSHLVEYAKRAMASCPSMDKNNNSYEHMRQEYPQYGHGDMREGAYEFIHNYGSNVCQFEYKCYEITRGKKKIKGLPTVETVECDTLSITLEDKILNSQIILYYSIFDEEACISRRVEVKNFSDSPLKIEKLLSMSLDFYDNQYEMIDLYGAWSRERYIERHKLHYGKQSISSMRGHSSNNFNPFFALARKETTENIGECFGFALVYSGNFEADVYVDTYDVTRVMFGIESSTFGWTLNKNEIFYAPESILVYSNEGFNKMSNVFHKVINKYLIRDKWKNKVRPILINNWEATYFDFNEEKIIEIATIAKEMGVELFVLDDGWFGKRNDDTSSLGDWFVNYDKIPSGINGLSEKIHDLGLQFGIWIEPEMININSNLYNEHPNWLVGDKNYLISQSRNQFILDFSNDEVVDYIFKLLDNVLKDSKIDYIKWDMNRSISEAYSQNLNATSQKEFFHRYILGVYSLYEKLISKYPDILFESCASGGARFDLGMLYYAPQTWTSDNTDAIERLKIQYGTSMLYPLCTMGSHISAIPNHQLFRNTPLNTRANVAFFGTFGLELDVTKLKNEEILEISKYIEFMKDYRKIIQFGDFYRLINPFESNRCAWMVVSEKKDIAIVGVYKILQNVNGPYEKINLQGLDKNKKYTVNSKYECYGDELMNYGLVISDEGSGERSGSYKIEKGDFSSMIYLIKEKEEV